MSPPRLALAVLLVGAVAGPAAADPADDLLRLVPPGAGVGVVVRDLRTHAGAVRASPFAAWFAGSELGRRLAGSAEVGHLRNVEAFLAAQFGVTADDLRDDVFGDAVVFAFEPGPPGKPAEDAGLFLVKPRKPEVLQKLVARLTEVQTRSGEVAGVRELTHGGRAFSVRELTAGRADYHAWVGGVFAFSAQERAIRAMLDRDASAPTTENTSPPAAARLRRLGVADACLSVWLEPRTFDAGLAAREAVTPDPGERAFLAQFRRLWAAIDGLAVSVRPGRDLEISAVAGVNREKLPAEMAPVLFPAPGGSAGWAGVPADALFAAGGRLDLPGVVGAAVPFLPADAQGGLRALTREETGTALVRGLGPDWAAWVRPPVGPGWVPGGTVVTRLGGPPAARADLGRALLLILDSVVLFARIDYNRTHADQLDLGQETHGPVQVRFLRSAAGFLPGVRPAYAVKGDYLVLASAPEEVARFEPPADPAPGAVAPPLVRVNVAAVRNYLDRNRPPLAAAVAAGQGRPPATVEAELGNLAGGLQPFRRVEVGYTAAGDRAAVTLRVEFAEPLRK